MTDPPAIYDPPRPAPPRAVPALIAAAAFNLVALILLLLSYSTAGLVFVALALVASVVGIFASRSAGPGSRAQTPTQRPQAPTAGR
jgi:hypothetical protein